MDVSIKCEQSASLWVSVIFTDGTARFLGYGVNYMLSDGCTLFRCFGVCGLWDTNRHALLKRDWESNTIKQSTVKQCRHTS